MPTRFAITARRVALAVLGGVWLCLCAAIVAAETINDLTAEFETLALIESDLLDQKAEIRARLEDPNLIWIVRADGSASTIPRAQVERMVGTVYDWLVLFGADKRIIESLPPEKQAIARILTFTGSARGAAIDKAIAELQSLGAPMRRQALERMNRIDDLLEVIRTWATETLAKRDALIRARNTGEPAPTSGPGTLGQVCFDDDIPATGSAYFAFIGGGGRFPMKGNFICKSPISFDHIKANSAQGYGCDRSTTPITCVANPQTAKFTRGMDLDTGNVALWFEGGGRITLGPPL